MARHVIPANMPTGHWRRFLAEGIIQDGDTLCIPFIRDADIARTDCEEAGLLHVIVDEPTQRERITKNREHALCYPTTGTGIFCIVLDRS